MQVIGFVNALPKDIKKQLFIYLEDYYKIIIEALFANSSMFLTELLHYGQPSLRETCEERPDTLEKFLSRIATASLFQTKPPSLLNMQHRRSSIRRSSTC